MKRDEQLAKIFATVLGVDAIDDSTSILTLEQWDSLAHVTLILELMEEFGVTISTDEAIEMISVLDIKEALKGKGVRL